MAWNATRQEFAGWQGVGRALADVSSHLYVVSRRLMIVYLLYNIDAATDAYVGLAIYDTMMAVQMLANARRSLWIFTEYDAFKSQCIGLRDDYVPYVAMNPKYIKAIEGAVRKARTLFEQANDERPGDVNRTWTQQVMPKETILLDALTSAFSSYHLSLAGIEE